MSQEKTTIRVGYRLPKELRANIAELVVTENKKYTQLLQELLILGNDLDIPLTTNDIITLNETNSITGNIDLPSDLAGKIKNKKYKDNIDLKDRFPLLVQQGYDFYTGKIMRLHGSNLQQSA